VNGQGKNVWCDSNRVINESAMIGGAPLNCNDLPACYVLSRTGAFLKEWKLAGNGNKCFGEEKYVNAYFLCAAEN